jgi:hypothetical protein
LEVGKGFDVSAGPPEGETPKYAFIGVRSCELQAITIQDKVFAQGEYADPAYTSIRERAFIVAVNCTQAGGTCFCVSMDTGPRAAGGYDLALTEVLAEGGHYFFVEAGSDRGKEVMTIEGLSRNGQLHPLQKAFIQHQKKNGSMYSVDSPSVSCLPFLVVIFLKDFIHPSFRCRK